MKAVLERDTLTGLSAPKVITSDEQNERYINKLLEFEHKDRLTAKERGYAELLGVLIENYEAKRYPIRAASPVEVIHELMNANDLRQKDLADIFGGESVVSDVLSGKRDLNKNHIQRLSERFHISPAVFFPIERPKGR
jgi:HTH-type transcriptional regulator/antitoxin HigA